jgi:tetratricopeptide (TPR) repeat protein
MVCACCCQEVILAQEPAARSKTADTRNVHTVGSYLDSAEIRMNNDLPKAFQYIEKALELSITSNDRQGEALSYRMLAQTNYSLAQYDLAIDYYLKALGFRSVLSPLTLGEIHNELGLCYEKNDRPEESLAQFRLALGYELELHNLSMEITTRYDIARVLVALGRHDKALQEYERIQYLEEQRSNQKGIATANTMKGEVYLQQNKPAQAITSYKKAEKIADETNDAELKSKSLRNQGKVYRQSRQYEQELDVRQQSLEISGSASNEEEQAEDNLQLGELYLETAQPARAVPYIERSIALSDRSGNIEKKSEALKALSEAYDQQGDYNKALISYKEYARTIDSLYARRERKLEANLEVVANVSRKLQRIDLLEQDYEISRKTMVLLEKEHHVKARELRIQKWITYGLVILVLGLAVSTLLIYRSALQKRKANLLLALRSLRSQMNPHFIFNSLNSVNSYIASNNERMANKYLSDFSMLMRSVLENSKHDFVPLTSELEVIKLYLKLEHSRFADKFEYVLDIDERIPGTELHIPPMLIQPYIENAVWHGLRYMEEKGKLEVELRLDSNCLLARVADNGIGRKRSMEIKTKHQQNGSSTGMRNTKSRLEIINEIYKMEYEVDIQDLDPEKGSGTVVRLKIPLNRGEEI